MAKKDAPRIQKAKNAIRGTFNTPTAPYLELQKRYGAPRRSQADLILGGLASLEAAEVEPFLKWLSGFPSRRANVFPMRPVTALSELKFSPVETRMSLAARVQFLSMLLADARPKIVAFDDQRSSFETALIAGDYDNSIQVLDAIQEDHGLSLWGIELRIAVLQMYRGLEAQKEYVAGITSSAPRTAPAVFASWISQRNEEGTIYARFRSRLRSSMANWKTRESITTAYGYLLGVDTFSSLSDEQASAVLASVASVSLIDAYTTTRDALSSLLERGEMPARSVVGAFRAAAPKGDSFSTRLGLLLTAGNNSHLSPISAVSHFGLDTLTGPGAPVSDAHQVSSPEPHLVRDLRRLVDLSLRRPSGFSPALDTGLKRLANLRHLDIAHVASGFVALQSQTVPVFELSAATPLYLFSKASSAWEVLAVPRPVAEGLLERTTKSDVGQAAALALGGEPNDIKGNDLAREIAARHALTQNEPSKALAFLQGGTNAPESQRRLAPLRAEALLKLRDLAGAVTVAGDLCSYDEEAGPILPLAELVRELRAVRFEVGDKLSLSLVLHEFLQGTDDREIFQQLQFAYEDTLSSFGAARPSEVVNVAPPDLLPKVCAFLDRIAIPSVMDVSFWLFKTSRDTLSERIAVCSSLLAADPDRSTRYREEIKEITRIIEIEKGIEDVDKSRVFIDLARLGRWAHQELRESFDRYKALTRAGLGFENPGEFEKLLKDFLAGKDVSFSDVAHYPKDEAGQLLIELFSSVVDRYFNDEDFGLDAYLSMRVRHGSLAGHLRGPLEEAGILVPRDKGTGKFPIPAAWEDLTSEITTFSGRYEEIVEELTKRRLQIKSAEHPSGLFVFELQPLSVYYVRSGIDETTTLDSFLGRVYDVLDVFLGKSLQQVRSYIAETFRENAEAALTALVSAREPVAPERLADLQNAIAAASPDWQASVDRVASWFAPSEESERASLRTMEQIVEIAIQATKNAHRGFDPKLALDIEDLGPQGPDVLVALTDVLFTILDNVHRHCGVEGHPMVSITLRSSPTDQENISRIELRVENEIDSGARSQSIQRRLTKIRGQIESGEYKSRVKLEGGTGFLKLKRIVAPDNRQTLKFGFVEQGFEVAIGMMIVFYPEGARLGV